MFKNIALKLIILVSAGVVCFCKVAGAEVILDGTVGPYQGEIPKGADSDYAIPADYGEQYGENLFHSFEKFNLGYGEIASFSGPNGIENIISRVTGYNDLTGNTMLTPSTIDGLLRSDIPGANLFLINPAGVIFGPHASLEIDGSFHVSTADYIKLADGVELHAADTSLTSSVLTSAPPAAFGFLTDNPAPISFYGSGLSVPDGETISVIGGNITIGKGDFNFFDGEDWYTWVTESRLMTLEGAINMVAVGSPGEVILTESGPDAASFSAWGDIDMIGASADNPGFDMPSMLITDGDKGGEIYIRCGKFYARDSEFSANTTGDQNGGGRIQVKASSLTLGEGGAINAAATNSGDSQGIILEIDKLSLIDGGSVGTDSIGDGKAGDIVVRAAKSITISGEGSGIHSSTLLGKGTGGNISIDAPDIRIDNGGMIMASSGFAGGEGDAGDITLNTDRLLITDGGFVSTDSFDKGKAGNITVAARESVIVDDGGLYANTWGQGEGGSISVETPYMRLDNEGKVLALTAGEGNAKDITLNVGSLYLDNGAVISTSTFGMGNAGNIHITALEAVGLSRESIIFSGPLNLGSLFDIGTESVDGAGSGGDITLTTNNLWISGHAGITAQSGGSGDAGNIKIIAGDAIHLNNGSISTEADDADGGNIDIYAINMLYLADSEITTSISGGAGNGGNIFIDPVFVILDQSRIIANAFGGKGGNIQIVAETFLQSPTSRVEASSQLGIDGTVEIDSPDVDVSSGLVLPANFMDRSLMLGSACERFTLVDSSSLVVTGRGGLPSRPEQSLASSTMDGLADIELAYKERRKRYDAGKDGAGDTYEAYSEPED